ncbi:hypothetical protein [Nostoc sp. FACHB-190]|uniref:hypothetical protein n=1 Tax=Nostoc sp. FACHB-190 TaxID=2692838 RepID=UPI0028C41102|nr:hypothetical protein [Nostoc sp. FACHB-190]
MDKIAQEKDIAIARMSKIVDNLIQGNNLYEERLQKREIMQHYFAGQIFSRNHQINF